MTSSLELPYIPISEQTSKHIKNNYTFTDKWQQSKGTAFPLLRQINSSDRQPPQYFNK